MTAANTTTSAIESQIAELNAKKEELERIAREEKRAEERAERETVRIAELKKFQEKVVDKAIDLMNTDVNNILTISYKLDEETGVRVPTVTFECGGRVETVDIEEHVVYKYGYRNNVNHGLKYRLTGSFNDYSKRMYKTAKSVLNKITEHQEIALAAQKRAEVATNRHKEALELLEYMYPDAEVKQTMVWDRSSGNNQGVFEVKGKHGTVKFRQTVKDGQAFVVAYEIIPNASYRDEMADHILLG